MKVTNPTITTLTVNWNPADGNVQGYKVIYVPEDGGKEIEVRWALICRPNKSKQNRNSTLQRGVQGLT